MGSHRDISNNGDYSARGGTDHFYSSTSPTNLVGDAQSNDRGGTTEANNECNTNEKVVVDYSDSRPTESWHTPSVDRPTASDPRLKRFSSVDRFGVASRPSTVRVRTRIAIYPVTLQITVLVENLFFWYRIIIFFL